MLRELPGRKRLGFARQPASVTRGRSLEPVTRAHPGDHRHRRCGCTRKSRQAPRWEPGPSPRYPGHEDPTSEPAGQNPKVPTRPARRHRRLSHQTRRPGGWSVRRLSSFSRALDRVPGARACTATSRNPPGTDQRSREFPPRSRAPANRFREAVPRATRLTCGEAADSLRACLRLADSTGVCPRETRRLPKTLRTVPALRQPWEPGPGVPGWPEGHLAANTPAFLLRKRREPVAEPIGGDGFPRSAALSRPKPASFRTRRRPEGRPDRQAGFEEATAGSCFQP